MTASSANVRFGFVVERKGDTLGLIRQVHGATLLTVESADQARAWEADPPNADGVLTWQRGIVLRVFTADCVPVLLYPACGEGPIAAVHAGWRGARSGIVAAAVKELGIPARDLVAVLGPSIFGCCFEVREDFVAAFQAAGRPIELYLERREHRLFCDLARFVIERELDGVGQIDARLSRCTYCSAPPLPSYRRSGGTDVRLRGWIVRD